VSLFDGLRLLAPPRFARWQKGEPAGSQAAGSLRSRLAIRPVLPPANVGPQAARRPTSAPAGKPVIFNTDFVAFVSFVPFVLMRRRRTGKTS